MPGSRSESLAQRALLEGSHFPAAGHAVLLRRGSRSVSGEIAWATDRQCGVQFAEAIDVADWMDLAGPFDQQRIDATIAQYRNGTALEAGSAAALCGQQLSGLSATLLQITRRLADQSDQSPALAEEILRLEILAQELAAIGKLQH
ncbi:hypothetical protein H9L15_15760 (plasmid) [Sphingomonas daechungensis]|uniref:Uncharacterized protein n=1 Tax=Sphingomonas daechungensis TaxID=1176646 RepID=A0ABX6T533_9SPHN|nr:hypothetical protein [Sphingomonas daechungensis]QNP44551.1 hypothetical protein H9L15_15760 [Sphingomonas daechungensis]